MTLLWLNMFICASASTVWSMWAYRASRRNPIHGILYAFAAVGAIVAAFGFLQVVMNGDPQQSAQVARWAVPLVIGAPAIARFLELLRDDRARRRANARLSAVEARADAHDRVFDSREPAA